MEVQKEKWQVNNFYSFLEILRNLKKTEIPIFVEERLKKLEENSEEKSISIVQNGKLNGSITEGYINSNSPVISNMLLYSAFFMDDKQMYVDFLKLIKDKDLSDFIWILHYLQSFNIRLFGYKGEQSKREEIYCQEQSKISIANFYKTTDGEGKETNTALCTERSAVIQNIASFCGINCYLIFGQLQTTETGKKIQHAYNIFKLSNERLILFDSTNPVEMLDSENNNKISCVPAYHVFDVGVKISDLEKISFDLQNFADIYKPKIIKSDESKRFYYTPNFIKEKIKQETNSGIKI